MSLSRRDGSSGFVQQGTVDWGQLASQTVSFSVGVLARLAAANVSPYTFEVARILGSTLKMTPQGKRNVESALRELKSYKLPGQLLWFGFGASHLVRQLSTTDSGFHCVALCGALSDYYILEVGSEILSEYMSILSPDSPSSELQKPSLIEWGNLIKACSGIFAASPFGTLCEELLQLNPHMWNVHDPAADLQSSNFRGSLSSRANCSSPQSIAKALHGISMVTNGRLEAITITGGNDIGWLAALSEWQLGLRIRFEDASGTSLYSNYDAKKTDYQILFNYLSRLSQTSKENDLNEVEVASRTFVLEDATDIFRGRILAILKSGRLPWNKVFAWTFGNDFHVLLTENRLSFSGALGCAARLLQGFATPEPGLTATIRANWSHYNSEAFGCGFISTLLGTFKELADLQGLIDKSSNTSYKEAEADYENHLARLALSCKCSKCQHQTDVPTPISEYCLVLMVGTVIRLTLGLSKMTIEKGLRVKRQGLANMYNQIMMDERQSNDNRENDSTFPTR
ncbi:hypothetical protein F4808DRAFT_365300 [Astrocystis sublimbata]|nr:hypothetical protein F4808DRAFT_365300 [Astrocystis sublimbata]